MPETAAIRAEAEAAFGAPFTAFTPCGNGRSSLNFKAVAADGATYFVKRTTRRVVTDLKAIHARVNSPLVPVPAFGGEKILAFPWREGKSLDPAAMTAAHLEGVLVAAEAFHLASGGLIHGDFHSRNFFFTGTDVTAIFDLEKARPGDVTDDLLRVFAHALERTRCWQFARLSALYRNFTALVARSAYPAADWSAAIDRYEAHKLARRARKGTFLAALEKPLRASLYRRLRQSVRQAKEVS